MPKPSKSTLEEIAKPAHIPGVSYAYVEPKDAIKREFVSTSLAVGKTSTDTDGHEVTNNTQFPASSLSKIVFTYLVLQLVKELTRGLVLE